MMAATRLLSVMVYFSALLLGVISGLCSLIVALSGHLLFYFQR